MDELLRELDDPVVLCRVSDLEAYRSLPFLKEIRADNAEYVTDMDLFQAASLLRSAKAVIANDCGMAHVAAATGVPTLVLFGPSSELKNRHPRSNVHTISLELECQPCQGRNFGPGRLGPGRYSCKYVYRCLSQVAPKAVLEKLSRCCSKT